jgi:hypothetical protein
MRKYLTNRAAIIIGVIAVVLLTITLQGANIMGLLATASDSLSATPATFYFTPYSENTLTVGQTADVDININARVPVNAIGVTVKFPPDLLEVVGFSKQKSFLNLWTEDTTIKEAEGELHFSGGTTQKGGLTGTSTTLTITVEAKQAGTATLTFDDAEAYASDGTGASVATRTHSITFTISTTSSASVAATAPSPITGGGGSTISAPKAPTPPSADLNGDGTINLSDMSILILHMFGTYDPRYDLNLDGSVNIADLSILMSKMGGGK